MTVQGYFDGTAVRTLEPLDLEPNQTVFINVPSRRFSEKEERSIREKITALDDVCGMLSEDEADASICTATRAAYTKPARKSATWM